MPKGYWIAHIDVRDAEAYGGYRILAGPAVTAHGGAFLVRGGDAAVVEGTARRRHILIEFPSLADAEACYRSAAYEAAKKVRQAIADADVIIVQGV